VDHAITYDSKGGKVYVFGGKGVGRSSKWESYSLMRNEWNPLPDAPQRLTQSSAVISYGRIYIVNETSSDFLIYSIQLNSF
jgi:hypothetical protein